MPEDNCYNPPYTTQAANGDILILDNTGFCVAAVTAGYSWDRKKKTAALICKSLNRGDKSRG